MRTAFLIGRGNLFLRIPRMIRVYPLLNNVSKMSNQSLNRPGRRIPQGTNRMSLHLLGQFPEHVDLSIGSLALLHPLQNINKPISTLSAGSALTARLMGIKLGQPQNCLNRIHLSIHDNNRSSAKSTLFAHQRVKVHKSILALLLGKHSDRGASRDYCQEIVPSSLDSSGMSLDYLSERNAHLLLYCTGIVDVS